MHGHTITHTYNLISPENHPPRFNGNTFEPNMKFELIGVLMGIAIFNRVILDLHFPMIAYGKILGLKPTLKSLQEYMPVGEY